MLTETRQEQILRLLREKGSVTVTELTEHFGASESTIRRDLNALHKKGALVKVFGGAVQTGEKLSTKEEKVSLRAEQNREEKIRIARHAAALVRPEDFVYLDAGTTTLSGRRHDDWVYDPVPYGEEGGLCDERGVPRPEAV